MTLIDPNITPGDNPEAGADLVLPPDVVIAPPVPPLSAVSQGLGWEVGDTGPPLVADITDATGVKVDLTGAISASLIVRPVYSNSPILGQPAAVNSDQTTYPGRVSYTWQSGDLSVDGLMLGWFVVVTADGSILSTEKFSFTVRPSGTSVVSPTAPPSAGPLASVVGASTPTVGASIMTLPAASKCTIQVHYDGTITALTVGLEMSLDGRHWDALDTWDLTRKSNDETLTVYDALGVYWRANLTSITGGGSATVVILAG